MSQLLQNDRDNEAEKENQNGMFMTSGQEKTIL